MIALVMVAIIYRDIDVVMKMISIYWPTLKVASDTKLDQNFIEFQFTIESNLLTLRIVFGFLIELSFQILSKKALPCQPKNCFDLFKWKLIASLLFEAPIKWYRMIRLIVGDFVCAQHK